MFSKHFRTTDSGGPIPQKTTVQPFLTGQRPFPQNKFWRTLVDELQNGCRKYNINNQRQTRVRSDGHRLHEIMEIEKHDRILLRKIDTGRFPFFLIPDYSCGIVSVSWYFIVLLVF